MEQYDPNYGRLLQEIKQLLELSDFSEFSPEHVLMVQKLAAEGTLNKEHLLVLIDNVPYFPQMQLDVQTETARGLRAIVDSVRGNQKAAIDAILSQQNNFIGLLEIVSSAVDTDEGRLKIAELTVEFGQQSMQIAQIMENISYDNNRLWNKIVGTTASAIVGAATLAAIYFINRGGKR